MEHRWRGDPFFRTTAKLQRSSVHEWIGDYWRPYSCYTDCSNSSVVYLCIASVERQSSVVLLAAAVAPFGVFNSDISATLATK